MTEQLKTNLIPMKFNYFIPEGDVNGVIRAEFISLINIKFNEISTQIIDTESFIEVNVTTPNMFLFELKTSDLELKNVFLELRQQNNI